MRTHRPRPMSAQRTWLLTLLLITLAVIAGADEEEPLELVLKGGQVIEVASAEEKAGQLFVTLPNGRMMAYALDDVDIPASRLTRPEPPAEPAEPETSTAADRPVGEKESWFESATANEGDSEVRITDDDVEHVEPEVEGEEEEGPVLVEGIAEASSRGAIRLKGTRYRLKGETLEVSGAVENGGREIEDNVTLTAVAMGSGSEEVGRGSTTVERPLAGGMSTRFVISMHVTGMPSRVRVNVGGGGAPAGEAPRAPRPKVKPRPRRSRTEADEG